MLPRSSHVRGRAAYNARRQHHQPYLLARTACLLACVTPTTPNTGLRHTLDSTLQETTPRYRTTAASATSLRRDSTHRSLILRPLETFPFRHARFFHLDCFHLDFLNPRTYHSTYSDIIPGKIHPTTLPFPTHCTSTRNSRRARLHPSTPLVPALFF